MTEGPKPPRHLLRLGRDSRLKQRREFTRLKTQGRRVVSGCLVVNWLPRADGGRARLGVVTSRQVGSAVVRSRARRLLREVWRRNQLDLMASLDMVLVARASLAGRNLAQVEHDFQAALRRGRILKTHAAA
jgi:ribonuclease P protein component